jgi:hypothetical protein
MLTSSTRGEPGFQFLRQRAQVRRQYFAWWIDVSKFPPNLFNCEPPAERHPSFRLHLVGSNPSSQSFWIA